MNKFIRTRECANRIHLEMQLMHKMTIPSWSFCVKIFDKEWLYDK